LPDCRSTTAIRAILTAIWMMISKMYIMNYFPPESLKAFFFNTIP
jgi:hypothetical protein